MGLLGAVAVGAMQKSIKDNRALRRDRKSLQDISKNYHEKNKVSAPVFNKMSDDEFAEFKAKLKETKKKEKIQRMIILGGLIVIGAICLAIII